MSEQENSSVRPEKVICVRARLKKNQEDEIRNWFNTMQHRKYEVLETFREEKVWVESVFLEKVGEDDFLIYYLRADDVEQAMTIFQQSSRPIDLFHKECWSKYVESATSLESLFDLQREQSGGPAQIIPEDVLVDVIALGKKRCEYPIQGTLAYATEENFLGRVVDGYLPGAPEVCLLSRKAAEQLCLVQNRLNQQGLGIFIFDAYRPLRAVRDFSNWFHQPPNENEIARKALHYPHLEKTDLAPLGYAPDQVSRHCFGNSVDLSLIDLKTSQLLDMGTIFDYFDVASHHPGASVEMIGEAAWRNRELLANVMQESGFIAYPLEYWHFDYHECELPEPADLEITPALANLNVH